MAGVAGLADWLQPCGYDRLAGIDRAGLMWEWLRRDPAYIDWYHRTVSKASIPDRDAVKWGLHFR